jgi:DNA-binding transcriptional MerR regulator
MLSGAEVMSSEVAPETSEASVEYTIDELAAQSQVPSRTIRFYQSKGVLPKPIVRGRVAFYGESHLERLKLIASLQDRGLRIEAIRELLSRIDKGELDVSEWLGLEGELQQPWDGDRPCTVTEEELFALAGRKRVGLLNELVRAKLVKRQGSVFLVPSPALLQISTRLEAAGIDLETAVKGGEILRKYLARTAKELTDLFVRHTSDDSEADLGKLMGELRPLALEAVRVVFAREMERELRHLVESGRTTKVGRRRNKR